MKRTSTLLSLVPTYFCNFRCSFCYLGKENLSDRTLISVEDTLKILTEVSRYRKIESIEILGGEIGIIEDALMEKYIQICQMFTEGQVFLQTNLSRVPDYFLRDDLEISVSYDYKCREQHETVLRNMSLLKKGHAVVMVATECLMRYPVDTLISIINTIPKIKFLDIKPFSAFIYSDKQISYKRYEEFLDEFIKKRHSLNCELVNARRIREVLDTKVEAKSKFQDGHVYISPRGKIAVIKFDSKSRESFQELDSFAEYLAWQEEKEKTIKESPICGQCEFLGRCTTEHNRNVVNLDNSCDGWYNLLKKYQTTGELSYDLY